MRLTETERAGVYEDEGGRLWEQHGDHYVLLEPGATPSACPACGAALTGATCTGCGQAAE